MAGKAAATTRQRGASLIEILVVLVIILFGIFAIIRIFPLGLGTLRTTESRTLAGQLANQQDELLKSNAAGMPQGVFLGYYDANDNLILDGTQDPDDLRPYTPGSGVVTNPNAAINPYFSDVNRERYIEGEAIKIPAAVTATAATAAYSGTLSASVYLLNFGPIFLPAAYGPSSGASQAQIDKYLRVYGAPLQSIGAPYGAPAQAGQRDNSSDVKGYLQGPQSYLIDNGNPAGGAPAHILFPASAYGKTFFISYSYVDASGAVQSVQDVQIVAGQDSIAGTNVGAEAWQQIPISNTGTPTAAPDVVVGSDRCSREFTRLPMTATGVAWTNDPYEYALLNDNIAIGGGGTSFANLGRIAFNPHGANYGTRSAYGQEGFTAYVDYSVLDWHILRDDREVPSGIPGANGELVVHTTLPRIKQAKIDVNPDNTLYDGMFGPATPDLIVVNMGDGSVLTGDAYTPGTAPNMSADYWVNQQQDGGYQTGTIFVNSNRVPAGSHLRVLYKADGDWAVALQKAYSRYQLDDPSNTGFPSVSNPRGYAVATDGAGSASLRLNDSEYNKSVVVRFQYTKADGSVAQTAPVQVTLDAAPVNSLAGYPFANKDVTGFMPNRKAGTPWGLVGNIATGVSVKSRVIYRDANSNAAGGAASNTGDPSAGWRIQDIDTYLTPAPSQP